MVAIFFCIFIFSGCGFYAFSLFVTPLQADLGWSRGEIMAAHTFWLLFIAVAAPIIGRMVDRHGARRVISIGAIMAGLGFVFLSMINNLWHFYAGYAVVGAGMAAMGLVPASTVILNWFKKRGGLAIGTMSVGAGAGGFILAPLIGGYLIPNFGWRASYLTLALLTWVVVIPLALLVIRTKPADIGLHPDGIKASEAVTVTKTSLPTSDGGLTLRMALATPTLWLIAISVLLSNFSRVGALQNQVPYLEDIGFPVATAAAVLGGVGLTSAVGKFGFGWLCDHIPAKYAMCIGIALQLVSVIMLINIGPASSLAIIWLYAIMMGVGMGSWLPTMSMIVSSNFGLASYGSIFGVMHFAQATGSAIGPLMAGYMYDSMNTYYWAFIIFIALYLIAIPVILVARRPKSLDFAG